MDIRALGRAGSICALVAIAGCGQSAFPVSPTPLAQTPVTTVQGSNYQGYIVSPSGVITAYNMTLIARGLGQTAQTLPQTPGTTVVTGYFSTGSGVTGTLEGTLDGSMTGGTLALTLGASVGGCDERRAYTGTITGSGVALAPGPYEQSCPSGVLDFTVQSSRPGGGGDVCSVEIASETPVFPDTGGTGIVLIITDDSCPWAAEVSDPFLSITSPATGAGRGTLSFAVQPNTGDARQGMIRIADQSVIISQAPGPSVFVSRVVPDPVVSIVPDFVVPCLVEEESNQWNFAVEIGLDPGPLPVRVIEWRLDITLGTRQPQTISLRNLSQYFPQAPSSPDGSLVLQGSARYLSTSQCLRGASGAGKLTNSFVVVDDAGNQQVVGGATVELLEGSHASS